MCTHIQGLLILAGFVLWIGTALLVLQLVVYTEAETEPPFWALWLMLFLLVGAVAGTIGLHAWYPYFA